MAGLCFYVDSWLAGGDVIVLYSGVFVSDRVEVRDNKMLRFRFVG